MRLEQQFQVGSLESVPKRRRIIVGAVGLAGSPTTSYLRWLSNLISTRSLRFCERVNSCPPFFREWNELKRTVFLLYEFEELSMTEIATAIKCPVQTAYSRLHAARREVIGAFAQAERKRT